MVRQASPPHSPSPEQKMGVSPATRTKSNGGAPSPGISSSPGATQMLLVQGPPSPHSSFDTQLNGTPSLPCGKYCRPMPMSAVSGALTNDSRDCRTASHLVVGAASTKAVGKTSSIEPEMSSITNMSTPIFSALFVSPRHWAPGSSLPGTGGSSSSPTRNPPPDSGVSITSTRPSSSEEHAAAANTPASHQVEVDTRTYLSLRVSRGSCQSEKATLRGF